MPGELTLSSGRALVAVTTGLIVISLSIEVKASYAIPPGRKICGGLIVKSKTVDSTPTVVGPASKTASMCLSKSSKTCCAVVGLGLPAMFPLGAAIGHLLSFISVKATLCFGILIAIVSKPATVTGGTMGER